MTLKAKIQLASGVDEEVTNVRIIHSRSGGSCTATFCFGSPHFMNEPKEGGSEVRGICLIDEEGELVSRHVEATFKQGQFLNVKAFFEMKSKAECERFSRFMERYSAANNMEFRPPESSNSNT
ncbi:MAG: photosystem II reaction center protein Psb28 [Cyanobacteria bacterium J06642_3]